MQKTEKRYTKLHPCETEAREMTVMKDMTTRMTSTTAMLMLQSLKLQLSMRMSSGLHLSDMEDHQVCKSIN